MQPATQTPPPDDFLPAVAAGQKTMLAAMRLQGSVLTAMMKQQAEGLTFLRHRYDAGIKLVNDLTQSVGVTEAIDICSAYAETTISDYARQTGRLSQPGAEQSVEVVGEPTNGAIDASKAMRSETSSE